MPGAYIPELLCTRGDVELVSTKSVSYRMGRKLFFVKLTEKVPQRLFRSLMGNGQNGRDFEQDLIDIVKYELY